MSKGAKFLAPWPYPLSLAIDRARQLNRLSWLLSQPDLTPLQRRYLSTWAFSLYIELRSLGLSPIALSLLQRPRPWSGPLELDIAWQSLSSLPRHMTTPLVPLMRAYITNARSYSPDQEERQHSPSGTTTAEHPHVQATRYTDSGP